MRLSTRARERRRHHHRGAAPRRSAAARHPALRGCRTFVPRGSVREACSGNTATDAASSPASGTDPSSCRYERRAAIRRGRRRQALRPWPRARRRMRHMRRASGACVTRRARTRRRALLGEHACEASGAAGAAAAAATSVQATFPGRRPRCAVARAGARFAPVVPSNKARTAGSFMLRGAARRQMPAVRRRDAPGHTLPLLQGALPGALAGVGPCAGVTRACAGPGRAL